MEQRNCPVFFSVILMSLITTLVVTGVVCCGSSESPCTGPSCPGDVGGADSCLAGSPGCVNDVCRGGSCADAMNDSLPSDSTPDTAADTHDDLPQEITPVAVVAEACANQVCTPVALATSDCKMYWLLLDSKHVYWMERCSGDGLEGHWHPVFKMPLLGGLTEELDTSAVQMQSEQFFFQDDYTLYAFSDGCCVNGFSFTINRASKSDGKWDWFEDLSSGKTVAHLTMGPDRIYYVMGDFESTLYELPVPDGSGGSQIPLVDIDTSFVDYMATDDTHIYLSGVDPENFEGDVYYSISMSDLSVQKIATLGSAEMSEGSTFGLATIQQDSEYLYAFFWGSLVKIPKIGGEVTVLVRDAGTYLKASLYGDYIYYSSYGEYIPELYASDGTIWAVHKNGGTPVLLASNQGGTFDIAAGPTGVYWVNSESMQLMRLAP